MKKVILLSAVCFTIGLLAGCCNCNHGNNNPPPQHELMKRKNHANKARHKNMKKDNRPIEVREFELSPDDLPPVRH